MFTTESLNGHKVTYMQLILIDNFDVMKWEVTVGITKYYLVKHVVNIVTDKKLVGK